MAIRSVRLEKAKPGAAVVAVARPRGRRPTGVVSGREVLLAAALSAFARNGYEATSLRTIAADADVEKALVARLYG